VKKGIQEREKRVPFRSHRGKKGVTSSSWEREKLGYLRAFGGEVEKAISSLEGEKRGLFARLTVKKRVAAIILPPQKKKKARSRIKSV